MKTFRVLSAYYNEATRSLEVVKQIVEDDDSVGLNLHIFSDEVLEWRAAEYGIEDIDDLVELIINEPFIGSLDPLSMTKDEARVNVNSRLSVLKARVIANNNLLSGGNPVTIMEFANVDIKYLGGAIDPIGLIKQNSRMNEATLDIKSRYIEDQRNKTKPTPLDITREQELEMRLNPRASMNESDTASSQSPTNVLPTVVLNKRKVVK